MSRRMVYEAVRRLDRVGIKISWGFPAEPDDHKVVDICLSIIDDYEKARARGFKNDASDLQDR